MGNFISKLFGSSKPETVTEKFARQDAEFKAKHPERFQQPTQPTQPTQTTQTPPAPGNAIGDYVGMTALQRREKAAGLKAGGMIRKKCLEGGEITGPGGPTDDLVPIDASNGEFMIKASSAKILGEDVLEALNDLGDEPKNKADDKAEDDKEGMKCGGKVKKMAAGGMIRKMAAGGPIDEQAQKDRQAISGAWNTVKDVNQRAGAAIADVATLIPRGLAGAYDSAVIRPMRAAGINAGYMSPLVSPAGADPSSMTPFYDKFRTADAVAQPASVEHVPEKPVAAGATPTPGVPVAPSLSQVTRQQRQGDPSSPDLNDPASNAMIENRNPGGMIRKVGNSYSGSNITGDVSFQGADGNALPGRPGGGFVVANGMSPGLIKSTLTNPDGSAWSAGDNAIMAANLRDGVDPYRGTSRDARNDPMNQPMTKDQRAARVRLAEVNMQDKRYGDANAIAQEQLGMSRTEHVAKMAKEKQVADVQAEYLAAGDDPVKLKAAERKLIAMGVKQPAAVRAFAVPGGQGFNADGTPYTIASSVYDPDTKQFIQQGGPQGAQAVATNANGVHAPTTKAEYDKLPKGAKYTHPDGTTRTKG
ncbi:hypothetical protein [Acidithiobacillus sp.]|uniref:hypothetical protein n=1 Tax=Acidithiobacillus sp. TaxID=1872118 RepID=UPI00258FF8A3|nr:hypothetical protein [Acidithiobacillus sp.]MDD5376244.1 hypothetical protein [Acidithiobacillus sp.]